MRTTRWYSFLLAAFLGASVTTPALGQIDVWVDPGHGGGDTGSSHPYDGLPAHYEKNITLQQGLALVVSLQGLGYNAVSTRSSDLFLTKPRRWKISNGTATNDQNFQSTCQVFISVHMNEDPVLDSSTKGTETYYSPAKLRLRAKDAYRADSSFAAAVHPRLIANANAAFLFCHADRHIKTELHTITKRSEVPALLIEVCFLTNQCQLADIIQGPNQGVVADGIAAGVSFYIAPLGPNGPVRTASSTAWDGTTYAPSTIVAPPNNPYSIAAVQESTEGFEGGTFPPAGWTLTTLGAPVPYRWYRTTDPLFVGDGTAGALVRGQSPGAIDEWLISPMVLASSAEHSVSFLWSGNALFAANANATCSVRPKGSSTWTAAWSLSGETPGDEWAFRGRVVDLTSWIGDSLQVAFRVAGTNGADFMIDDVAFGNFPPTTSPPNDLCANATQLPAGQATYTGSTCYATNNMPPPVGGACVADDFSGADVFYKLTAQTGDTLEVSVAGSWYPAAYLVSSCDSAASTCYASTPSLEIADHVTGSFQYVFAAGGPYNLVVDGLDGECGDFTLTSRLHGATTGVPATGSQTQGLSLAAWPNPARGIVSFSGSVPSLSGPVTISIHDAAGRLVGSLDVPAPAQHFAAAWDQRDQNGSRVRPGVYFARVSAGEQVAKLMVVLTK